ncbi:hypothetical protein DPEC_G00327160 [Dallia pectoralis]|uniref:Uncharacterized protein n=1 Tax=Dallia pectoralis TaxID=75939 RepID=A0ACC2F804_DALPE|nr:hypothetical protein DPEC_G00327160 [Dallia pectoralis]
MSLNRIVEVGTGSGVSQQVFCQETANQNERARGTDQLRLEDQVADGYSKIKNQRHLHRRRRSRLTEAPGSSRDAGPPSSPPPVFTSPDPWLFIHLSCP